MGKEIERDETSLPRLTNHPTPPAQPSIPPISAPFTVNIRAANTGSRVDDRFKRRYIQNWFDGLLSHLRKSLSLALTRPYL